jgi:hypothetical protein
MPDWLYHLPLGWMTLVVIAGSAITTAAVYAFAVALAARGLAPTLKAVSPVMLTPLAVLFALIVAFLASQVWTDVQRANAAVAKEASSLREVLLLASVFPGETESRARALVRRHVQDAVNLEWPAMARQEATLTMMTSEASEMVELTVSLRPQNDTQILAQREMLQAMQDANEARRERIVISRSSIHWVKWTVVFLLAVLILMTIAFVHIDNRGTAAIAMALFASAVAACVVLIASHNRPFTGQISVAPDLLLQVMP